jgi:hypothetical protein
VSWRGKIDAGATCLLSPNAENASRSYAEARCAQIISSPIPSQRPSRDRSASRIGSDVASPVELIMLLFASFLLLCVVTNRKAKKTHENEKRATKT